MRRVFQALDWFVPAAIQRDKTELPVWRNFVFTHIAGPIFSQAISVYLWRADASHGAACWIMTLSILAFLGLPFLLKFGGSLFVAATVSFELLAFASLFGAFEYGGVSSPFLPWLLVAVLLGFFYLSDRPKLVTVIVAGDIVGFAVAYGLFGFPTLISPDKLAGVGWISVLGGFIYMAWMANFYATIVSKRSELERETERHRTTAEDLRVASETAERASRGKSAFLARMSHELRTPLNAVIGYSELLIEDLDAERGSEGKRADLERINAAGKHLLSLVTEVIDVARIESDEFEVKSERVDVDALLRELVDTSTALAKVKKNALRLDVGGPIGSIVGDAVKLRQVLLNLIGNAAKFTSNGAIAIGASRIAGPDGERVEFVVADTGIGIGKDVQTKLFRHFSQASVETAKLFGGSGLGLAICAKLCAEMGGSIEVDSDLGRGARFVVAVPVTPPADDMRRMAA